MRTIIKGFALLGSVVLALPFVVAVVGCPPGRGAKPYRVERDFQAMHKSLEAYAIHVGQFPSAKQGLDFLVTMPAAEPTPRRWTQVMKKLPVDPWGTPYRYLPLGPKEREWRWELRCAGPDRVFGNRDDLTGEAECGDYLTLENGNGDSHPSY